MNQSLGNLTDTYANETEFLCGHNATNCTGTTTFLIGNHTLNTTPLSLDGVPRIREYTLAEINDALYLTWVCYPILLACCSIGNVLNLIVLASEPRKGSTNVYMMAVAVSDLFILWLYMPVYLYNISIPLRRYNQAFKTSFMQFRGLQQWGTEAFIWFCDWVLILFSLERLLAVIRPLSFQNLHTVKAARIIVAILLVLAGVVTFEYMVENYWLYTHSYKSPPWLLEWKNVQSQWEVIMTSFKFFALLILNLCIVAAIRKAYNSEVGKMRSAQQTTTNKKQRNATAILLGSVALYLVAQFPSLVVNFLYVAADHNTLIFPRTARLLAAPIVNTFFLANYSLNFFLYLTVSKRFRARFVIVFGKFWCCKTRNATVHDRGAPGTTDSSDSGDTQAVTLSTVNGEEGKTTTARSRHNRVAVKLREIRANTASVGGTDPSKE